MMTGKVTIKMTPAECRILKMAISAQRASYVGSKTAAEHILGLSDDCRKRTAALYDERIAALNSIYSQLGGKPDV